MLGRTFYHSTLKKYCSVFGNLFNDIYIRRFDSAGSKVQTIPVPIRYAAKTKWLELLNDPHNTQRVSIQLPFISFVITNVEYDSSRQTSQLSMMTAATDDKNRRKLIYNFVPYKLGFEMTIIGKNNDDVSQIWEQIIPYFTPDHSNTVNIVEGFPDMDIKISLQSTSIDDNYEGTFQETRSIKWTLNFMCDVVFAGPISDQGVIKKIGINYTVTDYNNINERTIITPGLDIYGKPVTIYEESIPYLQIEVEDDYGFVNRDFTFLNPKKELDTEE